MRTIYIINKYSKFVAIIPKYSGISIKEIKEIIGNKYSFLPQNISLDNNNMCIREIVLKTDDVKNDIVIHVNDITSRNISRLLFDNTKTVKQIQKELIRLAKRSVTIQKKTCKKIASLLQ